MPSVPTPPPEVLPVTSLTEYFRDSVDAAMATNQVAVETHTAHYVVSLLTCFARAEALHDAAPGSPRRRPLALLLADAAAATPGDERNAGLQHVGDVALFVAGFLAESLDRSPVGVDYYVRMGGCAYQTLADRLPPTARGRAYAPVFRELALRFQDMVDVLTEVRHTAGSTRDADVLRLYEQWLKTGSRRARRLLGRLGIEPTPQSATAWAH
jgi:hypothetical protein